MKILVVLRLWLLTFAAYFDYFEKFRALLAAAGEAIQEAVEPLMPEFNTWLAKAEAVMDWVRKSALTKKIAEADAKVDRMLVGINAVVEAGLHSFAAAIVDSAEKLHIMLANYGRVSRESYDEEAGDVRELLRQFAGHYAQDVNNLGLAMWVQYLQEAFDTFEFLLRQRADERMDKPPYTVSYVRKGLDAVYHRIESRINANAEVGTSPEFAAFIDRLNPEIDRLNAEFKPVKINLSEPGVAFIVDVPDQDVTGYPCTPSLTVYLRLNDKDPLKLLEDGRDYITTYKNNVKVGKATATIHGKGKYKGSVSITFNIGHQPLPKNNG